MDPQSLANTWQIDPAEIVYLSNQSDTNYVLELPSGRCRLDKGRRIRTMRSIMNVSQVEALVNQGLLALETNEN